MPQKLVQNGSCILKSYYVKQKKVREIFKRYQVSLCLAFVATTVPALVFRCHGEVVLVVPFVPCVQFRGVPAPIIILYIKLGTASPSVWATFPLC